MRLKQDIIEMMRPGYIRRELIYQFETTESTYFRWLKENRADGPLVSFGRLRVIADELKLPFEELIEEDKLQTA